MTRWEIPTPLGISDVQMSDGAIVRLRRHGNADGPRIVLSHGNGLASDLYYPFWSLLADRFDLIVYDLRNHGLNPVGELTAHLFQTFVADSLEINEAIDRHFGNKPTTGVFHSTSALVALAHQIRNAGFDALVLFDPPLCAPGGTYEDLDAVGRRMAHRARRRKHSFESREEFVESFRRTRMFGSVIPGVLELFAATTLRPGPDGRYELCCPPDFEAQVLDSLYATAVYVQRELELHVFTSPIKTIGSDPTVPYSFLPSTDLSTLTYVDYDFVPDTTHFLQLENPETCAAMTVEFLESQGLA